MDDTDEVDLSVVDVGGEDGSGFDFRFVNDDEDGDDDLRFVVCISDPFFERCTSFTAPSVFASVST